MRALFALLISFGLQIAECAAQTWELVKPDSLGVEAEFPGKPEYSETTGDDGGKIRTYALKVLPSAAYDLTVWDLPEGAVGPADVSRVLDTFVENNLSGLTAKLRTSTKIEIGGHEARDVVADVMGMVWRGRLVIAGNRLYQIVAIVSKTAENAPNTERYMASMKLH